MGVKHIFDFGCKGTSNFLCVQRNFKKYWYISDCTNLKTVYKSEATTNYSVSILYIKVSLCYFILNFKEIQAFLRRCQDFFVILQYR